jgi:tRNA (guanine-N7-)-methyltransferase
MTGIPQSPPQRNQFLKDKFFSIIKKKCIKHPAVIIPENLHATLNFDLFSQNITHYEAELGLGWGEVALERARKNPDVGIFGFEIKKDRIGKILKVIDHENINNLKIVPINLKWFFGTLFPDLSLINIHIFFPDPWPKKKHWKHRLINKDFIHQSARILKNGGGFYFATDYGPYARKVLSMMRKIRNNPLTLPDKTGKYFKKITFKSDFTKPDYFRIDEPLVGSRFEEKKLKEGLRPYYMKYKKIVIS